MRLAFLRKPAFYRMASLAFFFTLISILVFLSDGKQTMVDAVAAAGILCLYVTYLMSGRKIYIASWPLNAAWLMVLTYFIISTIFSDSVGYSISATIRYVMAYVLFTLFSSPSPHAGVRLYSRLLLWFVCASVAISWVATVIPGAGLWFPGMNLLYPTYGHNHIAALVIFILPLVVDRFTLKKNVVNGLLLLFIIAALIFSFARGALFLAVGYFLYRIVVGRHNNKPPVLIVLMITCVVVAFIIQVTPRIFEKEVSQNNLLKRQLVKNSVIENRSYYWKQAFAAIMRRPLFGTGPGTFYLLSKRYQPEPNRYSWYAHSYPLEVLAEIGIAGFIGVLLILIYSLTYAMKNRGADKSDNENKEALVSGVLLTLCYSVYEININFIVIWLLVWATLGILVSDSMVARRLELGRNHFSILMPLCAGFVAIYYVLSVGSVTAQLIIRNQLYSLLFNPYDADRVMNYIKGLSGKNISLNDQTDLFLFFHKKNPDILYALAKNQLNAPVLKQRDYYYEAISGDKTNIEYWNSYMQFVSGKSKEMISDAITFFVTEYGPTVLHVNIPAPTSRENTFLIDYTNNAFLPDIEDQKNNFVRIFYGLGLASLPNDPARTRTWWILARDSNPSWSYVHIELAALEKHVFQDINKAEGYLHYCQKFYYASEHCRYIASRGIPLPGMYKKNIYTIPDILDNNQ